MSPRVRAQTDASNARLQDADARTRHMPDRLPPFRSCIKNPLVAGNPFYTTAVAKLAVVKLAVVTKLFPLPPKPPADDKGFNQIYHRDFTIAFWRFFLEIRQKFFFRMSS